MTIGKSSDYSVHLSAFFWICPHGNCFVLIMLVKMSTTMRIEQHQNLLYYRSVQTNNLAVRKLKLLRSASHCTGVPNHQGDNSVDRK